MKTKSTVTALILGLSAAGFAQAADTDVQAELATLKTRLEQQDRQIAELRANEGDTWLNERRAEEIKGLIHEVLADAETRASFAEGGLTAGWRDNFFLASEDGNFLLRISGQSQTRYVYNHSDRAISGDEDEGVEFNSNGTFQDSDAPEGDEHVGGFQQRRTKIRFDGHIFDPKLTYALQMNASFGQFDDTFIDEEEGTPGSENGQFVNGLPNVGAYGNGGPGSFFLEDAWLAYEFADGWQVKLGQFKAPFLREEAVDSKYQLAAERSFTSDLFTVDYTQGIQLSYTGDLSGTPVRAAAMIHDGSYQSNTDFNSDTSHFAIAGRAELLLAGSWEQFDDFASWSGDSFGVLVGAAVDYEQAEHGRGSNYVEANEDDIVPVQLFDTLDILKWTLDTSIEVPDMYGLTLFGAVIGQHLSNDNPTHAISNEGENQIGIVLQAGAFVIPDQLDVFFRFEHIDYDGAVYINTPGQGPFAYQTEPLFDDQVHIYTVGGNYYFQKHAAKASLDVVYSPDQMAINNTGSGTRATAGDSQVAVRAQFQFLF